MTVTARLSYLGLALLAVLPACSGETVDHPLQGYLAEERVEVSCVASVEETSLTLRFINDGSESLKFVLADGLPPYAVERVGWDGAIELAALFVCPLTQEHDCFHGETVNLSPGASEERVFRWALPQALEPLRGKSSLRCTYDYETIREQPDSWEPAASLEIGAAG